MEQKRELSLDDMSKITGGLHDATENRRYENDIPSYTCPYCQAVFPRRWKLNNHISSVHPDRV